MIIFYEKDTGIIIGTIEGRIHREDHLGMWIGDKDKTGRIVCSWEKTKPNKKGEKGVWKPKIDDIQQQAFIELDNKTAKVKDFIVNTRTGKIEKKA